MLQSVQEQDKKIEKFQELLIFQIEASAKAISDIYEMRKETQKIDLAKCEDTLLDVFEFGSALYESISFQRKELTRLSIPKPYDKICHRSTTSYSNEFLFGSELMDEIKKATEEKKFFEVLKSKQNNSQESRHGQPVQLQMDQSNSTYQGNTKREGGATIRDHNNSINYNSINNDRSIITIHGKMPISSSPQTLEHQGERTTGRIKGEQYHFE